MNRVVFKQQDDKRGTCEVVFNGQLIDHCDMNYTLKYTQAHRVLAKLMNSLPTVEPVEIVIEEHPHGVGAYPISEIADMSKMVTLGIAEKYELRNDGMKSMQDILNNNYIEAGSKVVHHVIKDKKVVLLILSIEEELTTLELSGLEARELWTADIRFGNDIITIYDTLPQVLRHVEVAVHKNQDSIEYTVRKLIR